MIDHNHVDEFKFKPISNEEQKEISHYKRKKCIFYIHHENIIGLDNSEFLVNIIKITWSSNKRPVNTRALASLFLIRIMAIGSRKFQNRQSKGTEIPRNVKISYFNEDGNHHSDNH